MNEPGISALLRYSLKNVIGTDLIKRYFLKDVMELSVLCGKFSVTDPESPVN